MIRGNTSNLLQIITRDRGCPDKELYGILDDVISIIGLIAFNGLMMYC